MLITIDAPSIALAEELRKLQFQTNAMGGHHAFQGRTYGALKEAIINALACGLNAGDENVTEMQWKAARGVADDIYEVVMDCGEDIQYAIDYLNATYEVEYGCPPCGHAHEGYCDARIKEQMLMDIEENFGLEFAIECGKR